MKKKVEGHPALLLRIDEASTFFLNRIGYLITVIGGVRAAERVQPLFSELTDFTKLDDLESQLNQLDAANGDKSVADAAAIAAIREFNQQNPSDAASSDEIDTAELWSEVLFTTLESFGSDLDGEIPGEYLESVQTIVAQQSDEAYKSFQTEVDSMMNESVILIIGLLMIVLLRNIHISLASLTKRKIRPKQVDEFIYGDEVEDSEQDFSSLEDPNNASLGHLIGQAVQEKRKRD